MNYMFNLSEYETVDSRIHQFYAEYKDGRIVTEMELIDMEKGLCIFKAYIYKDSVKTMPDATGYADGARKDRGVDAQFWINNAETSSIGRALANLGLSAKGKRPSREEMSQVAPNHPALKVVKQEVKPAPQDIKEGDVDYWTTPIGASVKTTLAPVTLETAMATVTEILGTAEALDAPSCNHGHMEWRTGNSKGRDWAGLFCTTKGQSGGMDKCPTHWYNLSSDGKWQPQKARV
jgi:hypothetical protein